MPCQNSLDPASQIAQAANWIRDRWNCRPRAGIILGTGLGPFVDEVAAEAILPFEAIPHFRRATALGHRGRLVCGRAAGQAVVVMDGRLHAYEGYSRAEITFPTRVMAALGIETLIVTNAAGGLDPHYAPGDILLITDHINLMPQVEPSAAMPWAAAGAAGGAEPRQSADRATKAFCPTPYDRDLIERAAAIARRANFAAHRGVYIGVTGPNYETRAEYRFLRRIGGDAVGMSTVPEVLAAARLGLRILALSTITNIGLPDAPHKTTGAEVIAAAARSEAKVRRILLGVLGGEGSYR